MCTSIKMSLTFGSLIKCVGSEIILLDDSWIGLGDIIKYAGGLSSGDNGICVYILN